jgi:hypothetical protein
VRGAKEARKASSNLAARKEMLGHRKTDGHQAYSDPKSVESEKIHTQSVAANCYGKMNAMLTLGYE